MTQFRTPRQIVDGVLLLDKPSGISSNGALQHAKRLYRAEKAGHTGTLDPLATGLLPLCFGEATKFAQTLLDAPKRYTATIRFGITTSTGDSEGAVLATRPVSFGLEALAAALLAFQGRIEQVPPAFAALKYQGRNYYEYARAGIEIPRIARVVEIHQLTLIGWNAPEAVIELACSKGTYVRALAQDVGSTLGTGAHLVALRRTMTGGFTLFSALTLETLETMGIEARLAALLPADAPLAGIPRLELVAAAAHDLVQGRRPAANLVAGRYRGYAPDGRFVGLVEATATHIQAVRLVGISATTAIKSPARTGMDSG